MFCSFEVCFSECLDFDQGFGKGKVVVVGGGGGQWGLKYWDQLHGVLIESAFRCHFRTIFVHTKARSRLDLDIKFTIVT